MFLPEASRDQHDLVLALKTAWERAGHVVLMFETHISRVLVLETEAYKFKKPVRFDFLDFTTLADRRHYCEEELRLNRRLAPDLYLAVVPVTGSVHAPGMAGEGTPIEFALRMRAFRQQDLWTHRIGQGWLGVDEVTDLARRIAGFHRAAAVAPVTARWGSPQINHAVADDNYAQVAALVTDAAGRRRVTAMRQAESRRAARLDALFLRRMAEGAVRECHGDLHAGNILTCEGRVMAFDCIEFNAAMRWIDVMNDIAFTCMDLHCRGRADLAAHFLSHYLERSGDYAGLAVLAYYLRHRALVRCKIGLLRASQLGARDPESEACRHEAGRYLAFAAQDPRAASPAIMITQGCSGSGKSTLAAHLVGVTGALRVRSDVERKRLPGRSTPAVGLYDATVTRDTYARLAEIARQAVSAGHDVIIDAAFLRRTQRETLASLAAELNAPFLILAVRADEARMRERIARRLRLDNDPSDADLGVLDDQLARSDPLTDDECRCAIGFSMDAGIDEAAVRRLVARLRRGDSGKT